MKPRFFKLAEKLSYKSDHPDHKHGAVIVRNGKEIAGIGFNRLKTHSRSNTKYKMLHAELSAVINSGLENLSNCDIYIFRRGKDGTIRNSSPCQDCRDLLKSLSVKKVYFSHEDGFKMEKY